MENFEEYSKNIPNSYSQYISKIFCDYSLGIHEEYSRIL